MAISPDAIEDAKQIFAGLGVDKNPPNIPNGVVNGGPPAAAGEIANAMIEQMKRAAEGSQQAQGA